MNDDINIDELLQKWYETKAEIALLEKKCEKYKRCSEKIMDNMNKSLLSTSKFILKKVDMTRNTISKNDVPIEIWNKYSKETSFSSFYLTSISEKKEKVKKSKKKRSPEY
jgi:hypothetical protein